MFVQCKQSFVMADHKHISVGSILNESDPIVLSRPNLFGPLDTVGSDVVEQASAAPGEKRSVRRPKSND